MGLLIGVSGVLSPRDLQSMQHREVMEPLPPEQGKEGRAPWLAPCAAWMQPWTPPRLSFLTCKMGREQFCISQSDFQLTLVLWNGNGYIFFPIKNVMWFHLGNQMSNNLSEISQSLWYWTL